LNLQLEALQSLQYLSSFSGKAAGSNSLIPKSAAPVQDLYKDFSTPEDARKVVKLKAFSKFENTTEALAAAAALVDSKLSKGTEHTPPFPSLNKGFCMQTTSPYSICANEGSLAICAIQVSKSS